MASDFGDESGERLFDWMLRIGQDAGEAAIAASADRLKNAISNLRGNIGGETPTEEAPVREFARLNLSEFEELPDYASLKDIIDGMLDEAAIEHDFAVVDGHDHLVFRVAQASEVDEVFKSLEERIDEEAGRARKAYGKELANERDEEPLEKKVKAAQEASKAAREAKEAVREVERFEVKTR